MEGAWSIHTGNLVSLSEEQLVDCSKRYGNLGCNGGLMDNAFQYAIDNGMCVESDYPYTASAGSSGSCQSTCDPEVTITDCADVPANNQLALKEAVSFGPVSIAIEADTRIFQSYSSGVITSSSCGTDLDHGVLIVGYGTEPENQLDYWLVKNSWSSTWGDEGYVKIERSDSTNDIGICGIAAQPSFPIV
jgi:C1A family cysteine protease